MSKKLLELMAFYYVLEKKSMVFYQCIISATMYLIVNAQHKGLFYAECLTEELCSVFSC